MVLRWLMPLGLLGLLSIAALIIIYLIKPQFREHRISSTLIWKRVMMRRRKRVPMLTNLLVLILQIIALACITIGLTQPYLFSQDVMLGESEYVIVMDASASMLATCENRDGDLESRFDRARADALKSIEDLFDDGEGSIYVIMATDKPYYLVSGMGENSADTIKKVFEGVECSYGEADLLTAMQMAQERLKVNPYAQVFLYTDMECAQMGSAVTVLNYSESDLEWNIAIKDCAAAMRNNQWVFEVTLSAYGNIAMQTTMDVKIEGARNKPEDDPKTYELSIPVTFQVNAESLEYESEQTITFMATDTRYGGQKDWYFSGFDKAELCIKDLGDSLPADDSFLVYDGQRDNISIEYVSNVPNSFWQWGFMNMHNNMMQERNITFREIFQDNGEVLSRSGYDVYVFEHGIELYGGMPDDGVVILADPMNSINAMGLGFTVGEQVILPEFTACTANADHPLISYMTPSAIGVSSYIQLFSTNPEFVPVLYCGIDPIMYVRDTGDLKVIVLGFSINQSNFYGPQFQIFLHNVIEYLLPRTLEKSSFSVGEVTQLQCKGSTLDVQSETEGTHTYEQFPVTYTFSTLGTYTFTTNYKSDKKAEVKLAYAHVPPSESALFGIAEFKITLDNQELTGEVGRDLFFYFAAAILVIILVEWYLYFKHIM